MYQLIISKSSKSIFDNELLPKVRKNTANVISLIDLKGHLMTWAVKCKGKKTAKQDISKAMPKT